MDTVQTMDEERLHKKNWNGVQLDEEEEEEKKKKRKKKGKNSNFVDAGSNNWNKRQGN